MIFAACTATRIGEVSGCGVGDIDAGVPLHRLQRIAGHTDPRITQRYLHPDPDELRGDDDRLSCFLAAPGQGPATARQGRDGPKLVPKLRFVE